MTPIPDHILVTREAKRTYMMTTHIYTGTSQNNTYITSMSKNPLHPTVALHLKPAGHRHSRPGVAHPCFT